MLNPYLLLGVVAAFLISNVYVGYRAYEYADSLCDSAKWESQVKALNEQLATQKRAAESAAKQRDDLKIKTDELEIQVADYESKLESRVACVDPAAAVRLRGIR